MLQRSGHTHYAVGNGIIKTVVKFWLQDFYSIHQVIVFMSAKSQQHDKQGE
jgi:hypothetical protein